MKTGAQHKHSPEDDAARIAYGRALRIWATACGYTPTTLAARLGKSDVAVGKWMRGENRPSKAVEEELRGMGWAPEVVLGTEATPCP